ncbi:hypothetical protein EVAR_20730_1 [Eumeta japonica]|uniref:Uncharacterized protein n=1 Tax=Eumeta variegata TaxID=151549 RepID=A0A4C1VAM0_EUMVA|nr:hypothetical protein EVAR_20730_1 [Eumeta japonica]
MSVCVSVCMSLEGVDAQNNAEGFASGGARRRLRRRPPTASRLKGPRKQKSLLLKRGLAKSFAYKLLKRGLANLMSPTSTSGVAPPLGFAASFRDQSYSDFFPWPIQLNLLCQCTPFVLITEDFMVSSTYNLPLAPATAFCYVHHPGRRSSARTPRRVVSRHNAL